MTPRNFFYEKSIIIDDNKKYLKEVLTFLNDRTVGVINNEFKNNTEFSQRILKAFTIKPLILYRGEDKDTFPFLFIDHPKNDIYVENKFIEGGVFGVIIFSKPFIFDSSLFKENLQNIFISTEKDKYGFLILRWKSGDNQIRTDRKYRKDFYSVEAYHNGKCLFLNIVPEEGLIDFSYAGGEEWGLSTNISIDIFINFLLERINV